MRRQRLAVIGWGALGQACAQALHGEQDLEFAGVVRRADQPDAPTGPLPARPCVAHVSELGAVDAVLLCVPSAAAAGVARELLQAGMPLVECARFEGDDLRRHHAAIDRMASRHRVAAAVDAGWEPGVLPQLRQLFELLIPSGHTRVMRRAAAGLHHTAAAEGVDGVRGALCAELHDAAGDLRRYVYVELLPGADFERVRRAIESDPLFADEATQVLAVADLAALGHEDRGVLLERLGSGPTGPHASLMLEARLDETAFTARLMLDAARALPMHAPGAWRYTPFGLVRVDGGLAPLNRVARPAPGNAAAPG